MEVNILENKDNNMKFEIKGEDHTFCNLLRTELFEDKDTSFAGYFKKHPLKDEVVFALKTQKTTPKKALKKALAGVKAKLSKLKTNLK